MKLKALITFLLINLTAFAQTDPPALSYVVSGNVTDAEDGRPLQYVNVTVPGFQYATVSNSDGAFTIKSATAPEYLEFTLLGYKTSKVRVPSGPSSPLVVKMRKNILTLNEAVIYSGDPYKILKEAVEKIEDNFPTRPELFDCFYRETIMKRHRYIFISEAVARMYKSSYREGIGFDRVAVDKSRLLTSPDKHDTLSVKVVGGPAQSVMLDIVKDRDFFSDGNLADYKLEMKPAVMIDEKVQLAIHLVPDRNSGKALYEGDIYIDRESLSFTRIDLTLDMSNKDKATEMMLVKKPFGLRFTPLELSMQYNYSKRDGDKSRVSYVRTQIRFKCDWKKRLIRTDYTAVSELVTTGRRSGDVRKIPWRESFSERDSMSDRSATDFDPLFWKDYNIIEPTESLDRAIGRIKRKSAQ